MPKSGTAMSKASIPYLMVLRACCGAERLSLAEGIIVNHREVFGVAFRSLLARRLAGCDVVV